MSVSNITRISACFRAETKSSAEALPMARLGTEVNAKLSSASICNFNNCEGQSADSYCIQCELCICDNHQQVRGQLI